MQELNKSTDSASVQMPLLETESVTEEQPTLYRRLVAFFFLHVPDISYELNEKLRWKNVYTFIIMMSLLAIILNLSNGSMFDAYTFLLFGDKNAWVGYISGASGLVTLILAFPIGVFVDIWNRAFVTKVASGMLIVCTIFGLLGIGLNITTFLFLFTIFLKVSCELCISSGNTLFSDSLSMKDRVRYLSLSSTSSAICTGVGPAISLAYFFLIKDEWDIVSLRSLLFVSTLIFVPSMAIVTSRFHNINPHLILPDTVATNTENQTGPIQIPLQINTSTVDYNELDDSDNNHYSNSDNTTRFTESTSDSLSMEDTPNNSTTFEDIRFSQMTKLNKLTPGFVLGSNITRSFGTGMLVKYLPLYFKQDFGFTPIQVNSLLIGQALAIAFMINIGLRASYKIGRPITSLILSVVSSLAIFGVTYMTNRFWVIFFFLLRTGIQNAITPIDLSIIMDYTRSKHRGKWNSGYSFTQFLWSGSAFFGGFISDSDGYRVNFLVTAFFYLLACVVYVPILWMVIPSDLPFFMRRQPQQEKTSQELNTPLTDSD